LTTGRYPAAWEGDLIIGKKRGQRDGRPWSSAPRATSSWWAFPRGREGRPGAGALTRRIRALPDGAMSTLTWDQGSEMARHQRQGRRHHQPPTPTRAPSPTNRATAPAPPPTTPTPQEAFTQLIHHHPL